jgi:hypothetical protein
MRGRSLIFFVLLVGACGTPQEIPQIRQEKDQNIVSESQPREIGANQTIKIDTKEQDEKPRSALPEIGLTLTDIIKQEGIPTENYRPRQKEQISLYREEEKYIAFYFRENKVVEKKVFSEKELDKLKASSEYPDNFYKELGALP